MRTIFHIFRVPNLFIIALTFLMLRYLVFIPVYSAHSINAGMGTIHFIIMIVSTVLIAAAGYISNDYFDVVSDRVNKPGKQYIGKQITPGLALATSLLFSLAALILALWLSVAIKSWLPAVLLIVALAVVWWYAIHLKKSLLWGNLAVSCMSAGTIAMAWLIERQGSRIPPETSGIITLIITAISIFAFLLSLLREILKDIEDVEGDKLIKCRSLPIIKGIPYTKTILLSLSFITLVLLLIAQVYLFQNERVVASIWLLIFVVFPLIWFAISLKKSETKTDYHKLSSLLKWIMLGGILTMVAGQF